MCVCLSTGLETFSQLVYQDEHGSVSVFSKYTKFLCLDKGCYDLINLYFYDQSRLICLKQVVK